MRPLARMSRKSATSSARSAGPGRPSPGHSGGRRRVVQRLRDRDYRAHQPRLRHGAVRDALRGASPRHADMLLVTGPVTRNMEIPLRKTYEATPDPKLVVAVGDCARTCGVFAGSYAVAGSVGDIIPVDVFVMGCPPTPTDILRGILTALDRRDAR